MAMALAASRSFSQVLRMLSLCQPEMGTEAEETRDVVGNGERIKRCGTSKKKLTRVLHDGLGAADCAPDDVRDVESTRRG